MSIAVLKNRLLDMTDRQFTESRWGASSTRQFVELLDDVLDLDISTKPPTAILRDEVIVDTALPVATAESARRGGGWRIRRDLWDAVMDFAGGNAYLWDGHLAVAFPPGETKGDPESVLPTLTSEEFAAWRRDFATDMFLKRPDDPSRAQITLWLESMGSSQLLPPPLRSRWYGVLKHHVRARLEEWFARRAEDPPRDMATTFTRSARTSDSTEELRAMIIRAVGHMTRPEMEGLSLPVSVVVNLLK
jgi:hypothetical protein